MDKTQHPTLTSRQEPQPTVAVKLFQFDGARSSTQSKPVNVTPADVTAATATVNSRPASSGSMMKPSPSSHAARSAGALLRPASSPPANRPGSATLRSAGPVSGDAMLPHHTSTTSSSGAGVVMIGTAPSSAGGGGAVDRGMLSSAGSTTMYATSSSRPNQHQHQHQQTKASRATSTDLLFDKYKSKGEKYGPQCTQMNILHMRHRVQFQYGRLRRLHSGELQNMLVDMKKGIKDADKRRQLEDKQVLKGERPMTAPMMAGGGNSEIPPRAASASNMNQQQQQRGSSGIANEFEEDNAVGEGDEEEDAIEAAFKSQRHQTVTATAAAAQSSEQPAASTTSAGALRPGSGLRSSAGSSRQQQQQQQRPMSSLTHSRPSSVGSSAAAPPPQPPRAPSSAGGSGAGQNRPGSTVSSSSPPSASSISRSAYRGGSGAAARSPTGGQEDVDPRSFRGRTVSLERSYLDSLQTFLSPTEPRQRRNPSPNSTRRSDSPPQQQQQPTLADSRPGTAASGMTTPPRQQSRPSSIGGKNRSPLTASILRNFSASSASRDRKSPSEMSRPASADHLLQGTRWHRDVDHGDVPDATAVDPQDLPQPESDLRIDSLPDELKFYAVRPSSPKAYSIQPPPSYFFEQPTLPSMKSEKAFSPDSVKTNSIYPLLSAPSKYRCMSAGPQRTTTTGAGAGAPSPSSSPASNKASRGVAAAAANRGASAAATASSPSATSPGSPVSPIQFAQRAAQRQEAELKQSISAMRKTTGIVDYLQERKLQRFCQYSSVIKRKLLELDHAKRQAQLARSPSVSK